MKHTTGIRHSVSVHAVSHFLHYAKYTQRGQPEEGKIDLGGSFQGYFSPQSLVLSIPSQHWGKALWQREHAAAAAHLAAGRKQREETQDGAGYSLPQTSSLVTYFFQRVPTPCFHHLPTAPSYQKPIKGLTHWLEHSSQDAIISQETMSSTQVLGAWAYKSQTMTLIYY